MSTEKSLEQKLRRALTNQGYQLRKSRAQNWTCDNQKGYMIVDSSTNMIEAGERFDMTLEDVEVFANG